MNQTTSLRVSVRDVDDEATAGAAVALYDELCDLPVDSIDQVPADSEAAGSRGGDAVAVGEFLLQLASNRDVVVAVLAALQEWIGRWGRGSLVVVAGDDRIEVPSPSPEQQQRLVDAFIERVLRR